MPSMARAQVDVLEGLTTVILVDQERMGGDVRSTVGTVAPDATRCCASSSAGSASHIGSPNAFSFNVPSVRGSGAITVERGAATRTVKSFTRLGGMCPRCEDAVGERLRPDAARRRRQVAQRGRGPLRSRATAWMAGTAGSSEAAAFDPQQAHWEVHQERVHHLLHKEPTKIKVDGINLTYEASIPKIQKSMLSKDVYLLQPHVRVFVDRVVMFTTCPDCGGTRLSERGRRRSRGSTSPTPRRDQRLGGLGSLT